MTERSTLARPVVAPRRPRHVANRPDNPTEAGDTAGSDAPAGEGDWPIDAEVHGVVLPRRRKPEATSQSPYGLLALLVLLVAGLAYLGMAILAGRPTASGIAMLPVLLVIVTPIIRWVGHKARDGFDLKGLLFLAFALRMLAAIPRFQFYSVDSVVYNNEAFRIAAALRHFDFGVPTGRQIPGTGSVRYLAGVVHVFVFDDFFASFLFFAAMAFIGACLFIRAFQIGVPDGDQRRYALLVCLLPSLLFWPSSMGKEAIMSLTVGLASIGVAWMFRRKAWRGFLIVIVGLGLTTLVRPHIALIAVVALAGTAFLPSQRRSTFKFVGQIAAVLLVLIGGSILARQTAEILSSDDSTSVVSSLDEAESRSSQGNSAFQAARVNNPADYPVALVTVYFRPFLYEVNDVPAVVNAFESVFLVILFLTSVRRYRKFWSTLKRYKYVGYSLVFVLAFAFAFSAIGNFGILVRQRTQAFPLLLVLLALPDRRKHPIAEDDPMSDAEARRVVQRATLTSSGERANEEEQEKVSPRR